jgi:two-component system response regulator RegX3
LIKVLVIDRDEQKAGRLAEVLQGEGIATSIARERKEALRYVDEESPDAILLGLAEGDAREQELCREIRERTAAPLLLLGQSGQESALARGLDAGGDALLLEPCSKEIVLAQMYASLRCMGPARPTSAAQYDIGTLAIDVSIREVRVHGNPVELTPTEFEILRCLFNNSGRALSYRTLARQAHGYDCSSREARKLLKVHIHRLRQKIEPVPRRPRHILNVRGFGYLFERRRFKRDN